MSDKKNKVVNYRRCEISPKPDQTLQQLIGAALEIHPLPGDRFEPLNPESTELRCIGLHYDDSNCLCGYMTSFERGAAQPVISDDPVAASLRLGALAPPAAKRGTAQQQYIPGVLYFVVFQNHVVIVQNASMRARAFEMHLNWLLKSRTSQLPATSTFALSDEAQKATKEKIRKSHVKAVAFGQPLMSEVALELVEPVQDALADSKASETRRGKKELPKFQPTGMALGLFRSLFSDEADFEKLGLNEIFDGNLEVWVEIRYPKYKRSNSEDAVKLMDTLGIALRDMEGDQVTLQLANGHKVHGKDLKITGRVDSPTLSNKLPDEKKLLNAMVEWLKLQFTNGAIDP